MQNLQWKEGNTKFKSTCHHTRRIHLKHLYHNLQKLASIGSQNKLKSQNEQGEQNGYPKNQSFEMIETLLEIMKRTLESGEDVLVSGFGKFCVREQQKRREGNPSTGEDMILKPKNLALNDKPHVIINFTRNSIHSANSYRISEYLRWQLMVRTICHNFEQ